MHKMPLNCNYQGQSIQVRKDKPRVNKNLMVVRTDKPRFFAKALDLSARTNLGF